MTPDLGMMLAALFPDAVEYQFVPNDWASVTTPVWDGNQFMDYTKRLTDKDTVPLEVEEIQLEPITEESPMVYAGMSQKTHIVFVRVEGV